MSGQRIYIHPHEGMENYKAVYVRLDTAIQRPTNGCDCTYCKSHPGLVPAWDTLVIPLDGSQTYTVHWPDLEQQATLLVKLDKPAA
jgi:hypothetical protein